MRKKILPMSLLCLALAMPLTSCVERTDVAATTEVVQQEQQASLPAQGGLKRIQLSLTDRQWVALSNADWLSVSEQGTTLELVAQPNTSIETRKATVSILVGETAHYIEVEQAAADFKLGGQMGETLHFEAPGAQQKVMTLGTNAQRWSVESSADWLHATSKDFVSELVLDVAENADVQPRTATLTFTAGTQQHTIEVSQAGATHYVLPDFRWGADFEMFSNFEEARGSVLLQSPRQANPAANVQEYPYYTFQTKSRIMPRISYETLNASSMVYYRAVVEVAQAKDATGKGYRDVLKAAGFKKYTGEIKDGQTYFYNEEQRINALIQAADNGSATITFWPQIPQREAYPTLPDLIYGFMGYGQSEANIRRWEELNGGHFDEERTTATYISFFAPAPLASRTYFWNASDHTMVQPRLIFNSLNVGMYRVAGLYYPTTEFEELLRRNGFVRNLLYGCDIYVYTNNERRISIYARQMSWAGEMVFSLRYVGSVNSVVDPSTLLPNP